MRAITNRKPNQFRCVLTDKNQQTGVWGDLGSAENAAKWHAERGYKAHVESRHLEIIETEWTRNPSPAGLHFS